MSPKIDWNEFSDSPKSQELSPPGNYHVEVADCEERTSAAGNTYFNVRMKDLESGRSLCFDIIMLSGKGLGMGLSKLKQLGFDKSDDEIVAAALVGRRAWVCLKEDTYEGNTRLVVDISAKGSSVGYWHEDTPPGEEGKKDPIDLEDAPF